MNGGGGVAVEVASVYFVQDSRLLQLIRSDFLRCETNKQKTNKQTNRQKDKQTNKQTERQTNKRRRKKKIFENANFRLAILVFIRLILFII